MSKLKVIPLGGLGEIGKNITAFEYDEEILVIDCGMGFPDEEMYGVDLIIPDVDYLINNKEKVKGIFLTHAHEDHIGALPYILKQINIPVYGTKLTLGIVGNKLKDHGILNDCNLQVIETGKFINFNNLKVEFIRNTHSIADSCSIAIHTPLGIVIHTGDFKIDYTPIDGKVMDLGRMSQLGEEGVLLLMADSTNVQRKGHSISEKSIGETLDNIFSEAKGRVIVATFASNIHRMQQIINASIKFKRKVAFSGRSMESISRVAIELGYLHPISEQIIDVEEIVNYPANEITIITTGSQGEPMAALARIAYSNHKYITIQNNDLFIISASPIPGNDKLISRVINQLFKKGADVIYEDLAEVHVSGHAYEEELKLIHTLVKPKYFMPVHGEYRHLKYHAQLAEKLGMEKENIFILETGEVLEVDNNNANINGKVKCGNVFVDGLGVGDVGNIVLRDRQYLAKDGMVIIVCTIENESYTVMAGPDVITRGFVYAKEAEELIKSIKYTARVQLEECLDKNIIEWYVLKSSVKKSIEKLIFEKTKRRPSVIPIIMEI